MKTYAELPVTYRYMNRRDLLKAGSSLGLTVLAGCSEKDADVDLSDLDPRGSDIDLPGLNNDDSSENEELSKPERVEETTLPAEHTIAEWRGTSELGEGQYHLKQKIPPSDSEKDSGKCFVLECEISPPEGMLEDEEVDLFLITESAKDDFEDAANPKNCVLDTDYENCPDNSEAFDPDRVLGDAVPLGPEENEYIRYLLTDDSYYFIIDGSDALGGRFLNVNANRNISEGKLDTQIRVLEYTSMEAREEARDTVEGWTNQFSPDSSEDTVDDIESFAEEVCRIDHQAPSGESIEELAQVADQIEDYSPFIGGLLDAVNKHYNLGLSAGFVNRLEKMARWGSTALPVVGSIVTVAEKACALADDPLSEDERKELAGDLLLSLAGLLVEIIFIQWGAVSRVAKAAVETTEQFVFGYIRKIGGLRLFAYLFRSLTLHLEDGLFATITEFAERVANELIDEDDVTALAKVATGADSWGDLDSLDERDCSCENLDSGDVCQFVPSM